MHESETIACPNCERAIPASAEHCPHCATESHRTAEKSSPIPWSERIVWAGFTFLWGVLFVVLTIAVFLLFGSILFEFNQWFPHDLGTMALAIIVVGGGWLFTGWMLRREYREHRERIRDETGDDQENESAFDGQWRTTPLEAPPPEQGEELAS